MSTRRLLQLAAFGAATVLLVSALGPINTAVAVISPLVYAAIASLSLLAPFAARLWSMTAGAATFCAALAGVIVAPFSALGFLLLPALVVPALCFDLVLWRATRPRIARLLLAAGFAGFAIWGLSLPIISHELLTLWYVVSLAVIRVLSYIAISLLARTVADRLRRIGVHAGIRSVQGEGRR